jgi:steroid delta-isomerase-like uncharacterized protein
MEAENKALVRAFFDGLNARDLEGVVKLTGADYVNHSMPGPRGSEALRAIGETFLAGFPDMQITLDDVIAEADRVATRGRWTGTHQGEFMGIPATGRSVEVGYIDLWRIEDGLMVENWVQMDIVGMMTQLGVMSEPSAAIA